MSTPNNLPRTRKVERPQPPKGVKNPAMFYALRAAQFKQLDQLPTGR